MKTGPIERKFGPITVRIGRNPSARAIVTFKVERSDGFAFVSLADAGRLGRYLNRMTRRSP